MGQVACGMVFPEATLIRDFTSNVYSGDYLGAAMNIGGTKYAGKLFTVLRDSSLVTAFVKKVGPTEPKIGTELMDTLREQGIYRTELPAADKVGVLDKAFGGAATRLSGQGVADEAIADVYESGGNLGKTMNIIESQTGGVKYQWLEEGKLGWIDSTGKDAGGNGWEHIKYNHIYYGNPKEHFEYVFGPNYATEEEVQQLIYDGAKYGTQMPPDQYGRLYSLYDVPGTGRQLRIGMDKSGKIITAYPVT